MKAKHEIVLEKKMEERVYRMSMEAGAPLGEAYESAAAFLDEIVRLIKEHAEKREKVEVVDEKPEEKPEEVKEEA